VLILALLLLLAGVAFADSPGQIVRAVIGSGGGQVQTGHVILNGTIGQSIVSPPIAAGNIEVASGFWQHITTAIKSFLPAILK